MRRTSLLLLFCVPLLLVSILFTLAGVRAWTGAPGAQTLAQVEPLAADAPAPAQQDPDAPDPEDESAADDETAVGEPEVDAAPLDPPLSIRIRQSIPLTVALTLLRPITTTLSPTDTLLFTGLVPLTDTEAVTLSLGTDTDADTDADAAEDALDADAALTETLDIEGATLITGVLPLTDTEEITGAETLTDVLAVAALPVPLPDDADLDALAEITGTLPLTAPAILLTSDGLTTVPPIFTGVGITMDLDLQIIVTDTLTSTVPAVLVLRFSGMPTLTLPVSITVNAPSTATVSVLPVDLDELAELTETETPTVTGEITGAEEITLTDIVTLTPPLTATVTATPTEATPTPIAVETLAVVTVTVPVTTNVRLAPAIDAEIARRAAPGEVLNFVAINAAGDWLLLREGNWVAVIALGEAPAGLPTASDELVAALRAAAALTPTPTPTPAPPTPIPAPTVAPSGPVTGTATTNANLRSGPGTTFNIVGNTTVGQLLTIVGRTEDGAWFLLDTGSWISATLVTGAPPIAQIPIFDPNAPPTPTPAPILPTPTLTTTAPVTGTPSLLPTATPTPGGPAATPAATPTPSAALTVDENIYLVEFDTISANYERSLSAVDRLVDTASGNPAVFQDPQWVTDMNTAIQLIRNAGADVTQLVVPERFAAAHNSLTSAATQYSTAADLLAQGVAEGNADAFDEAFAAVTLGDASMAQAAAALSAFRP